MHAAKCQSNQSNFELYLYTYLPASGGIKNAGDHFLRFLLASTIVLAAEFLLSASFLDACT